MSSVTITVTEDNMDKVTALMQSIENLTTTLSKVEGGGVEDIAATYLAGYAKGITATSSFLLADDPLPASAHHILADLAVLQGAA